VWLQLSFFGLRGGGERDGSDLVIGTTPAMGLPSVSMRTVSQGNQWGERPTLERIVTVPLAIWKLRKGGKDRLGGGSGQA